VPIITGKTTTNNNHHNIPNNNHHILDSFDLPASVPFSDHTFHLLHHLSSSLKGTYYSRTGWFSFFTSASYMRRCALALAAGSIFSFGVSATKARQKRKGKARLIPSVLSHYLHLFETSFRPLFILSMVEVGHSTASLLFGVRICFDMICMTV